MSIDDVLTEVNKKLMKSLQQRKIEVQQEDSGVQQPDKHSTLNKKLFLGMQSTSSSPFCKNK